MDENHEALGDDPAAAFEALRAKVAALRTSLGEGDGRVAPDYAPTLGKTAAAPVADFVSAVHSWADWAAAVVCCICA